MGLHSITSKLKKKEITCNLPPKGSDYDFSFINNGKNYLVKIIKVDKEAAIRISEQNKYIKETKSIAGVGYNLMTYKDTYDMENLVANKDNIILVFKEPANIFVEYAEYSNNIQSNKHLCAETYKQFLKEIETLGA